MKQKPPGLNRGVWVFVKGNKPDTGQAEGLLS
jgi:hypothetical protein